jgi:hypothetical protein
MKCHEQIVKFDIPKVWFFIQVFFFVMIFHMILLIAHLLRILYYGQVLLMIFSVFAQVLSLIQIWADAFRSQPDLNGVVQVYNELKGKGIEFPAADLDALAPIYTPQRVSRIVRTPEKLKFFIQNYILN